MTQFEFFLNNLSFRKPENLNIGDLRNKVEHLSNDCEFIRSNNETIYRHPSVYEETIIDDWNLCNMHNPEFVAYVGRDYQYMLQVIVDQSTHTDYEHEFIVELLESHSEQKVYGLICLHDVQDVDSTYCVYDRNNWYQFHRFFLGLYPINYDYFADRSRIYYPRLHFHQNISATLKSLEGGLPNFSKSISKCLSKLNDDFPSCFNPSNIVDSLRAFSAVCGYETTNEGNIARKDDLTFDFISNNGNTISVYCEPHIKLSQSDNNGDTHFYYNRIYFHVGGKLQVANGKCLVAHIGYHL